MDQPIWAHSASGVSHLVSGVVALNADIAAPSSGRNSWYTFALHELGHAVGLNHTSDATQIMAPTIPPAAVDYGSGDLAGLAKVGGSC
jgi:predicted Zn-dependent protease